MLVKKMISLLLMIAMISQQTALFLHPYRFATDQTVSMKFRVGKLSVIRRNDGQPRDGGGRFSSSGRGRGRGRSADSNEGFMNSAEIKNKELTYDSASEIEVVRLHAPEDRVPLSALSDGQKLRGRIVSVKE